MRDLIKASILTWIGSGALMLAALIRGKVLATALGPTGVGVITQLMGFTYLMGLVGSLSLGSGIAQYVAQFLGKGAVDNVRQVVQTALLVAGTTGAALSLGVWVAAPYVSGWLFDGDRSYAGSIQLLAVGIVATSLAPNFQAVFSGYGAALLSSISDIAAALATVGFTLVLVGKWGLQGAVIALVLIHFTRLGAQMAGLRGRYPDAVQGMLHSVDWRAVCNILTMLFRVASASMIMVVSDASAQLIVRSHIIRLYGLEANGLYQAAFASASQVLVTGMGFVSSYAFARVNSASTSEERTVRTNQALHLALLLVVLGVSGLILFRNVYIYALLSPDFEPAGQYFAMQATGEAFKQLGLAVGMSIILVAGVRAWMLVGLIWGIGNPLIALALLPLGEWALPLPYLLTNLIYFAVTWFVMSKKDRFRMSKQNLVNLLSGFALILFLAFLPSHWATVMGGITVVSIWCWFALGHYRVSLYTLIRYKVFGHGRSGKTKSAYPR